MMETQGDGKGAAFDRYAVYRRAGELVHFAGIVAVDPVVQRVVNGYSDLPEEDRRAAGETGHLSVDSKDGPIAAQAWYIMQVLTRTVASAGGTLSDVVNLTQYFTDLRDLPIYSRIRSAFFEDPPASTCVQVAELLPNALVRLEVQAVAYIKQT